MRDGEVIIVDEFTGRTLAGPALVRWPASGGRSEGRRADPAREPDARLDHVPELFPHVQEAGRHDRHGRHGSLRVPADLRPRSGRHPDAQADGPQGQSGHRLPQAARTSSRPSSKTSRIATSAASRCWSARRRSRRPSCFRDLLQEEARSRTKCSTPSSTSARRTSSRRPDARRGHDRHEHGRPRHRHRARRHRSKPSCRAARKTRPRPNATRIKAEWQLRHERGARRRRPAHHRHRTPRIAPHRQPAARPLRPSGRPGFEPLLPVARRFADAHLRARLGHALDAAVRHEGTRGARGSA